MNPSLKSLIANNASITAPGVGDALGAIMVERCGFPGVYVSGYQVSATLGYPDVGLITMTEMVNQLTRICASVKIPVISDADTGYGGVVNVIRTVQEYERAGVSALHLEDQIFPKKCARYGGKELVRTGEMCAKIRAATGARSREEFLVIARTDALSVVGLDEAIARGNAYHKAGADAVMFMGPRSIDDLKKFRAEVEGPLVVTLGSWDVPVDAKGVGDLGYQIVLIPNATMRVSIKAILACLEQLKASGDVNALIPMMAPLSLRDELVGLEQVTAWERKYAAN